METAASAKLSELTPEAAGELSAFARKTYVDTFGAGFPSAEELDHHLDTTLTPSHCRDYLVHERVTAARIGGELAAYVHWGPGEREGEIDIHRLYVDRPWQGQGLGSRLLKHAIAEAEAAGATAIWIDVWDENFGAQRLYAANGFVATEQQVPFVLKSGKVDGYDIRMVKTVSPSTSR